MNDDLGVFLVFPIVILVVILVVVVAAVAARQRRNAFMELAKQHGWRYHRRSRGIPKQFVFLDTICQGHSRYASNILDGEYQGRQILAFDYHYTTGSGKNQQTHQISLFLLKLERPFPELRIFPESVFSKLGQMIGYQDIDFESVEFSNAFTVQSDNRKFAYDICHTRMMEWLLQHPRTSLEIERDWLCTWSHKLLDADKIVPALDRLLVIRSLFPGYLFSN